MSTTLHAFSSYTITDDNEINYENDKDYDIAYGNWHYIYTALKYSEYLTGVELSIPVYDYIEDGWDVKNNGMNLTEPEKFIIGMEATLTGLGHLPENENLLIDEDDWYLFEDNTGEAYQSQKEQLILYSEMLLNWAQEGLHFVVERE